MFHGPVSRSYASHRSSAPEYNLQLLLGPLFNEHVGPALQRPFKGSALLLNDKSRESIKRRLAEDVYVSEGVWDLENALIMPFRTLMRKNI